MLKQLAEQDKAQQQMMKEYGLEGLDDEDSINSDDLLK
jgi:hypothetical protein